MSFPLPPFTRTAVVDQPGIIGARWWQEDVSTSQDDATRRQVLTGLAVVAAGVVGVAAVREVVDLLQGRALAGSANEVHGAVAGDVEGAEAVAVEAGLARGEVEDDALEVVVRLERRRGEDAHGVAFLFATYGDETEAADGPWRRARRRGWVVGGGPIRYAKRDAAQAAAEAGDLRDQ